MRVVVTGGAGFIGSHLCDAFHANGDEVWVIDDLSSGRANRLHEGVRLYRESVRNASRLCELVTDIQPELICHLAAQVDVRESVASPGKDAEANVLGTINVLEAARAVGARMVFSSTGGAIYGQDAPVPSSESTFPAPGSPYGVAKYCSEQYVGLYNRLFGSEHAVLRFSNVYGPRQGSFGEAGVVSVFCANSIQGKPITIFGDGKQTRDYVYVADCVAAFMAAADYGKAGIWNIGTGTEVGVLELAELVNRFARSDSQLVFAPARAGELTRSALACELAAQDLGWQPATSLADGVQAVVRWFEAGAPDRTSL
ncbi:NAD-dependent epimerase/dehydratase family protein [Trebonia kvetii]|uniref:NAD-dependent epimerase/dehydratase family protein n=1 Tax=Trebonia kvetii TaxID=2480626 RepID=A0A6P2C7C1_9ACTN|nr:NAD-dependent epimerase/dehydratase family protein [Trebonia kvetii]TVZ07120.1 NAD-dependent epimerase/dehydratase family protein [Trebonia kvetii]